RQDFRRAALGGRPFSLPGAPATVPLGPFDARPACWNLAFRPPRFIEVVPYSMDSPAMRLASLSLPLALAALLVGWGGAQAQTRAVPASQAQVQLSFAPVVRQTAGAVVNVYATRSE